MRCQMQRPVSRKLVHLDGNGPEILGKSRSECDRSVDLLLRLALVVPDLVVVADHFRQAVGWHRVVS